MSPPTNQGDGLIGLGCMRLSTELSRDGGQSCELLVAALHHGANLLDTAPCYALGDWDLHHNERLVAEAVAAYQRSAPSGRPLIATKGGLQREGTSWVPDGRARSLRESCERSLEALEVSAIDIYQLHAIDPSTPLETSVRALASLQERGLVRRLGLSNVGRRDLDSALRYAPIEFVQVALSPFDDTPFRSGLFTRCKELGITVLAHSPLGGPKKAARLARDPVLSRLASKHESSAQVIALAWLYGLGVVPLPGPSRVETALASARARRLELDEEDWAALDARFAAAARASGRTTPTTSHAARTVVTLLMGLQGSGKSARALALEAEGGLRINGDELSRREAPAKRRPSGKKVLAALEAALTAGTERIVLDNTHLTRASRNDAIVLAKQYGARIRCEFVDTPHAVALALVTTRLVDRYGHLPNPEELRALGRHDPQAFGPSVVHRARRELEPPALDEGFDELEIRKGPTSAELALASGENAGVAISADAALRLGNSALDDLARETAASLDYLVFHWAEGSALQRGDRARDHIAFSLGVSAELAVCEHGAGPPVCWCRPPLVGLLVPWMRARQISPSRAVVVGDGPAHRRMAETLGCTYIDVTRLVDSADPLTPRD
ncbi:MAG: aldo/keto reductase [Polyangiaceae bacterium]